MAVVQATIHSGKFRTCKDLDQAFSKSIDESAFKFPMSDISIVIAAVTWFILLFRLFVGISPL